METMSDGVSTQHPAALRTDIKLSEESFLSDAIVRQLISVGEIDILVGLPALLRSIYGQEYDLVLPTYARHKFDGLLITNLLYPMTRALYGLRIREPYASEFAFSGRLGSQFLAQNSWNDEVARTGCEVSF